MTVKNWLVYMIEDELSILLFYLFLVGLIIFNIGILIAVIFPSN